MENPAAQRNETRGADRKRGKSARHSSIVLRERDIEECGVCSLVRGRITLRMQTSFDSQSADNLHARSPEHILRVWRVGEFRREILAREV